MKRTFVSHKHGPKRSDDSHNFWNYAMTKQEVDAFLRKKHERRPT